MADVFPKKLEKCPLIETVLEIRFSSSLLDEAVFGVIYNSIQKDYSSFVPKPQPILQIPLEIRKSDPNIMFQPLYRLENNNLSIGISPKSIIFSNTKDYKGWTAFKEFVQSAMDSILTTDAITSVQRIGIRYINVISESLFDATLMKINLGDTIISKMDVNTSHIEKQLEDGMSLIYQLNNNVQVSINGEQPKSASMIDIDSVYQKKLLKEEFSKNYSDYLEMLHKNEKKAFFDLLNKQFLESLKPIY